MKTLIEFYMIWVGVIGLMAILVYAILKQASNNTEIENDPEFQERMNQIIDNDKNL